MNKSYELLRLTPSRDGRGRDSVRSRRSKPFQSSTNRKTSPEDTRPMWEKQVERFRKEMELISYNPSIDYDDVSKTESERISSGVAATKSSNDRQSHNNETFEEECGRYFLKELNLKQSQERLQQKRELQNKNKKKINEKNFDVMFLR